MGLFSDIGGALGGPLGGVVGAGLDIGGGLIAGGQTKGALDRAVDIEAGQAGLSLEEAADLRARNLERTDPFTGAGTRATGTLEELISGSRRLDPTAGETFAQEQALRGINRAAAGTKSLQSGARLVAAGERAADIGSQFRQQDIRNLQDLAGRGFSATGLAQTGDIGVTSEQNRLRELIGNIRSGGVLGKTQADVANISNISGNLGNLANLGGGSGTQNSLLPTNPRNVNFNPTIQAPPLNFLGN